jgi:hypothetical protein
VPLGNAAAGRFVLWCDMGRFGTRYFPVVLVFSGALVLPERRRRLSSSLRSCKVLTVSCAGTLASSGGLLHPGYLMLAVWHLQGSMSTMQVGCATHACCVSRSAFKCSFAFRRSAYVLWACHLLGCLLLPRLLPARLVAVLRGPSSGMPAGSQHSLDNGGGGNGVAAPATALLRLLGSPLLALHDMSTMGIPWLLQVWP